MRVLAAASILIAVLACGPSGDSADPAAGSAAPEPEAPGFTLERLDGGSVTLADLRGKVVVLDFWATWCPPCEFQIPILNDVHARLDGERVAILGVSVDTEGPEKVRAYLDEHPAEYPILMGSEALARKFGAPGFPSLIVVDPQGRVDQIHVGLMEAEELEEAIGRAEADPEPAVQASEGP